MPAPRVAYHRGRVWEPSQGSHFNVSALLATLVLVLASPARADETATEQARQHYEIGSQQYDLGHWDDAIREFEKAYELRPDPSFLYNLAQAYKEKGDLAEAEKSYQAAVRVDPKYAQAYYNYGNLLGTQKRFPAAISAYKSAIAADRGMEKAYYNMALAYMNTEQYPEALQAYKDFVKAAKGKPALKGQVQQIETDIIPKLEETIQGQ